MPKLDANVLIAPAIRGRLAGNRDIGLAMIDLEHHLLSTAGPLKVGDGVMVCAEHGLGAVVTWRAVAAVGSRRTSQSAGSIAAPA